MPPARQRSPDDQELFRGRVIALVLTAGLMSLLGAICVALQTGGASG